ncbi:TPA: DUF5960 family protein [Streptococcus suis]|nr:hypothetical protein [Streptococcus suis]NQI33871.1 hypothetical protein [Streptococcus suis]NQP20291.1 hypothetical protein [Streptococcus suis]NQP64915.1 hypothetical protein [Streptococcus suis]
MNLLDFQRNELQMDYSSESYQDFERDFYRYSDMNIPLTFLIDDILKTMAASHKNYFVLNKEKSLDNRDHYFIFQIETLDDNKLIRKFIYQKTTTHLA